MTGSPRAIRAPAAAALARLCEAVAPGSRVLRVRRLRGGLDAATHAVELVLPSGERRAVVLRRYRDRESPQNRELVERTWHTLALLERLGLPAPRPVWLDPDGAVFGTPTFIMSRVPGRPDVAPRDPDGWARQLGAALAAIHTAPIDARDTELLRRGQSPHTPAALLERAGAALAEDVDGTAIRAALDHWQPLVGPGEPALVHDDFWAGNTLWLRGRLQAVVDWDWATVGTSLVEVGYCRMDLAMLIGPQAPDVFLAGYEAAAGRRVSHLFYWDLLGSLPALPDPVKWLPGYHDLGRTDITPDLMRDRLRAFVAGALARAAQA